MNFGYFKSEDIEKFTEKFPSANAWLLRRSLWRELQSLQSRKRQLTEWQEKRRVELQNLFTETQCDTRHLD